MSQNNDNMATGLLGKSVMMTLLIIPTGISLYLAAQLKQMTNITEKNLEREPQIVCFEPEVCAIEVRGKWYHISGVIDMQKAIPEEYKLKELIDEAREKNEASNAAKSKSKTTTTTTK